MTASAQGADVSAYQPVLTSASIRGLDFVLVKATEGTTFTDPHFAANWEFLATRPVIRGAYHFFHPGLDVLEQIAFFIRTVTARGLRPGDMLAADTEITSGLDGTMTIFNGARSHLLDTAIAGVAGGTLPAVIRPGVRYPHRFLQRSTPARLDVSIVGSASAQFLNGIAASAAAVLGGQHCRILCYSYLAMLPQLAACTSHPLWVADYTSAAPSSAAPWNAWTLWQYSGGGAPDGGDQDAYNGTAEQFRTWAGAAAAPAVPAWEITMLNALPQLQQGSLDKPGQIQFTHRAQALARVIGQVNKITAAAAIPLDGTYDDTTKAGIQALQKHFGITDDGIIGPQTWGVLVTGSPA